MSEADHVAVVHAEWREQVRQMRRQEREPLLARLRAELDGVTDKSPYVWRLLREAFNELAK